MRTLYVKFVVITIAIMVLSSILAFIISNTYYQQKLKPYNDEKITVIAGYISDFIKEQPYMEMEAYLESVASTGYQIYLVDSVGDESFFGAAFREEALSNETKELVLNGDTYHGILHFPQETFVTGFFANELQNTIGVPVTYNNETYALFIRPDIKLLFNEMHYLFAWLIGLTIFLSVILVALCTKYLVKPISKLTAATKSLAQGEYDMELDTDRLDELGTLSASFSQMAKKLERVDDARKEFVSNISHDIQSPLSNIKGYTNLLRKKSINNEEKNQYITIINDEIKRLSNMTDQLLLLSSLDSSDDLMNVEPFNVGQQIKELIRSYQWQINEKGITLGFTLPDIPVNGDPSLLYTVWDNLLSNAIKYNKPGGSIKIGLEEKDQSVIFTIENTGERLKEEEIEKIFDRFYRADTARTRTIEGTGLGLSIVQSIIKLHKGDIHVDNSNKEKILWCLSLPNNVE